MRDGHLANPHYTASVRIYFRLDDLNRAEACETAVYGFFGETMPWPEIAREIPAIKLLTKAEISQIRPRTENQDCHAPEDSDRTAAPRGA